MKRTMKRHIESLGQVFSEGVFVDEECVSPPNRTREASTPPTPMWTVKPHVRPTTVTFVAAASSSAVDPSSCSSASSSSYCSSASASSSSSMKRGWSIEAMLMKGGAETDFSSAVMQNICSHVDLFYYSDLYMSRCVEDHQDVYQALDSSGVSSVSDVRSSDDTITWWRHLVAGGIAGAVSRTSTAPLDRLKVFLMVYGSGANDLRMSSALQSMLKEGGIESLWRGNGMNVAKVMPEMALKFMAYEQIKSCIKGDSNRELNFCERFASGSLAGTLSQSAIYPLEVIKTRLVIRKTSQYSGICDCAKNMLNMQGVQGFYRGYVPNILGIIPYAGIDLAVYETLKRAYMSQQSLDSNPGAEVLIVCAVISSTCGQLVSYPLSLIRTRLQAHSVFCVSDYILNSLHSESSAVTVEGAAESSVSGIVRTIAKTDGVRGFYRGLLANLMKVAPAVSISYVVYEKVRLVLGVDMS